jgi:hypothetical protein
LDINSPPVHIHSLDAKDAKKLIFLLFAETPKSKKQLALRAELMSISDLAILLYGNTRKLYTLCPFLFAIGDSFLCFPASQRKT